MMYWSSKKKVIQQHSNKQMPKLLLSVSSVRQQNLSFSQELTNLPNIFEPKIEIKKGNTVAIVDHYDVDANREASAPTGVIPEKVERERKPRANKLDKVLIKRPKYTCLTCGRSYTLKTALDKHTKTHAVEPSTCSHCSETFSNVMMLKTHMIQHTGVHPYKCSICQKGFIFETSMMKHLRKAHQVHHRQVPCDICKKMFTSSQSLDKHKQTMHIVTIKKEGKSSERIICSVCGKSFASQYMNTHMKIVHGIGPTAHVCQLCNEVFYYLQKYKLHMVKHANERDFICEKCGSSFFEKKRLINHLKTHSDALDYHCTEGNCSLKFKYKFSLNRHIAEFHKGQSRNAKAYTCLSCGKHFQSMKRRDDHDCISSEYHCNCGRTFTSKNGLTYHKQLAHMGVVRNPKPRKTGDGKSGAFACSKCDRTFISNSGKNRHYRRDHINEAEYRELSIHKPVTCSICDVTFKAYKMLVEHMRSTHNEILQFECKVTGCEKSYNTPQGLQQHKTMFHDRDKNKRYPCTICNKELTSRYTMKLHMTIHTGQMNFKCSQCPKAFRLHSNLKAHELTHTNSMPEVCSICSKSFRKKSHLRTHMRTHTGERPYACEICFRRFAQSGDRNKHRINIHKE